MKITLCILSICLLFACQDSKKTECNYITDYYPNTSKAELEFYLGNFEKAFEYYEKAFKNCESINIGMHDDTAKFARICAELGKTDLALDYIEKRIKSGGIIEEFDEDALLVDLLKTKRGQKIVSDYKENRANFISSINLDLRKELQEMMELDQQFNSTKYQDSMFQVNDKRLVEIFEEFGYPNEQVVGSFNIDRVSADPSILLLHTADSIRINYFFPKVKEFVKNGKCPPLTLGTMYDNLELFSNRPQTHGTYMGRNGGYASMISDTSKVNANRRSIGLPTLEMTKKIDSIKLVYFK